MTSFARDLSLPAVIAGFVTVLVGLTSSAVIVFQAAQALGASAAEIGSWMLALGLGMGLTSIVLSLRYRIPVVIAWSTPGAAMLITSAQGIPLDEAIGAFLVSALLITIAGFSRVFEQTVSRVPMGIASGMLAGVLVRFGMDLFVALQTQFSVVFPMLVGYLLVRRYSPRYSVVVALFIGAGVAGALGLLHIDALRLEVAQPVWTTPRFSFAALIGIGIPLFIVTMASQNVPGMAVLRASGYNAPISPIIGWTGIANVVLAPFGAFALNLAAITAAICMGREAHEDHAKRYTAAVVAGAIYCVIGVFGATVAGVFAAFPRELVVAIAGIALLGTIGNGLVTALASERDREAALITFLVTASGMTLLGVGSAFWGLIAGALALALLHAGKLRSSRKSAVARRDA